jgi:hypothetical protein
MIGDWLRPISFTFGLGDVFEGYTDDATWRGYLHVFCTAVVRDDAVRMFKVLMDDEAVNKLRGLHPDLADGLIDLGCWTTREIEPPRSTWMAALSNITRGEIAR